MATRFTSESGRAASKRRKTRYPTITHTTVAKKKDKARLAAQGCHPCVARQETIFTAVAAITPSARLVGLQRVIDRMHEATPFTRLWVWLREQPFPMPMHWG